MESWESSQKEILEKLSSKDREELLKCFEQRRWTAFKDTATQNGVELSILVEQNMIIIHLLQQIIGYMSQTNNKRNEEIDTSEPDIQTQPEPIHTAATDDHPQSYETCRNAADVLYLAENDKSVTPETLEKLRTIVGTERFYGNMIEDARKLLGN